VHGGKQPLHDQVCFHCQQSIEKYFKALLEELGQHIPKTHDLERLLNLLVGHYPLLNSVRRSLKTITTYAVETRYPGESTSKRQAVSALKWAGRVRGMCRNFLGLK
jgi:HEPN domain-containing protein